MTKKDNRRAFLGAVGASAVAAASVAAVGSSQSDEQAVAAGVTPQQQAESRKGYQLTEHVRRYYETAMS
ncbi:MAG: hypothetical protein RIR28_962 [Pseudomonadota bacterium]